MDNQTLLKNLEEMFPNAGCELIYHNPFEFLCAVLLSAQTTDKAVNKVTKELFLKYPTPKDMSEAPIEDLKRIIKPIGLSANKSKFLHDLAVDIVIRFDGMIPTKRKDIESLKGVGRKTCNVYLSEIKHIPNIAVDTHVKRVSIRLGLVNKNSDVLQIERSLKRRFDKKDWIKSHHLLLFLGRYLCKAKNPNCHECKLKDICKKVGV